MTFCRNDFSLTCGRRLLRWLAALLACTAIASFAGPGHKSSPPRAAALKTAAPVQTGTPNTPSDSQGLVQLADGRLLAPDIARIVTRGELIVAMREGDAPPFFFEHDGVLMGLEVTMAREIASALKIKVRFDRSAKNFNEVVEIVARQEADLGISKLSRTLARAQTVRFSDPYLTLNHALVLNRMAFSRLAIDQPVSQVIRNFRWSIGVIAGSSFFDFAMRNFPDAEIHSYPTWEDVLMAVNTGEVIGAYRDEFEIKRIFKSDPTAALTLRIVTLRDVEDTLGIAMGKGDPGLAAFVNQFLAQRKEKLDIQRILEALEP